MFIIEGSDHRVQAWSRIRLPFEPRDWLIEFRAEIRKAIRAMHAAPGRFLHGIYSSEDRSLVDAENVLYYNVGPGFFEHLARQGIGFERRFATVAPPREQAGSGFVHHVDYQMRPVEDDWHSYRATAPLLEWECEAPCTVVARTASWWFAVRQAIAGPHQEKTAPFLLDLTLAPRSAGMLRATDLLKPVFDGVVAAMHRSPPIDRGVLKTLSTHIQRDPSTVEQLLTAGPAPLGLRLLLRPWGKPPRRTYQWDPADDLCMAGRLLIADPGTQPSLRGRLYLVK